MDVVVKPRGRNGNRGQTRGKAGHRGPILTPMPPLRHLFEILDARKLPYDVIGTSNEQMCKWRQGKTGISGWNLIEFADKLGCDIVVVPRSAARTLTTLMAGDGTHAGGGMAPAGVAHARP